MDAAAYGELRRGAVRCLEAHSSILNAHWEERRGASPSEVTAWERKHGQLLPSDMRSFYELWDGVACRWDVVGHGREIVLTTSPRATLLAAGPSAA